MLNKGNKSFVFAVGVSETESVCECVGVCGNQKRKEKSRVQLRVTVIGFKSKHTRIGTV